MFLFICMSTITLLWTNLETHIIWRKFLEILLIGKMWPYMFCLTSWPCGSANVVLVSREGKGLEKILWQYFRNSNIYWAEIIGIAALLLYNFCRYTFLPHLSVDNLDLVDFTKLPIRPLILTFFLFLVPVGDSYPAGPFP